MVSIRASGRDDSTLDRTHRSVQWARTDWPGSHTLESLLMARVPFHFPITAGRTHCTRRYSADVDTPVQTASKHRCNDPIGRGQRELIIGRQTVKQPWQSIRSSTRRERPGFVFTLPLVRKRLQLPGRLTFLSRMEPWSTRCGRCICDEPAALLYIRPTLLRHREEFMEMARMLWWSMMTVQACLGLPAGIPFTAPPTQAGRLIR